MKKLATMAALALPFLVAAPARAERPDPGWAFVAGAASALAGFVIGGALLGTSGDGSAQNEAGWLAIQGGFVLAPLAAHAVVGEWGRAAAFSAVPAAAFAGSAALLDYAPNAVAHGTLEQQRVIWALFGAGLFASAIGVVDVAFAGDRGNALYVAPMVSLASPPALRGVGTAGLAVGGVL